MVVDDAFAIFFGGAPEGGEGDFIVIDFVLGRGAGVIGQALAPYPRRFPRKLKVNIGVC